LKKEQQDLFEDVIQVSGVGPKVALGIISTFTAKELRKILLNADYKALSKVKGLGQKGAKKIVLELQGVYIENEEGVLSKDVAIFEELEDALGSLGFQGKEVKKLIKKAGPFYKENNEISIEALIAYVLKN
jgi:holliday junction DNA helicase RuvA